MTCRTVHVLAVTLALAAFPSARAFAQAAVEVVGLDGKATKVALEGMNRHVVTADDHGAAVTFEGVLAGDVLAKAGVELGEKLHGPTAFARFVRVTARDGYTVVFAIAELDPAVSDTAVIIADRRDGKRLDDKAGPLQIVSPYEKRQARWVRQLARLEVVEAK